MSRPLRVMLLSHLASRRAPTGAERSLAVLAKGLAGRGHRVAVVAPGPWVLADELERAGVGVEAVPSRACWLTYWEPRPWPVVAAKWLRHAWPSRAAGRLERCIEVWQPDVVHVNCLPHLRGVAAARRSGRPVVWHLREILPAGPRRRFFARRLAASGAHLVAVSRAVAVWLAEERLEASVVHNGIELPDRRPEPVPARMALGLPAEGIWVGYAGQLLPHKGAMALVHAAARACREVPELRVVIAGSGPDRFVRALRAAISQTDVAGRFVLLPPQPTGAGIVAASDIVCVPTLTPDPLPRTVMEAMAAGRPVVSFPTGGIPEMVDDGRTGLLVPTGDEPALADALARLGSDPERCLALGDAARRTCRERFSIGAHLEAMEALLERVSAGAGAAR